jgi:hypothetical protein
MATATIGAVAVAVAVADFRRLPPSSQTSRTYRRLWWGLTAAPPASKVGPMQRHRGLLVVSLLLCIGGFASWYATKTWEGWEYILDIVGKGDNMPIAGLIPIIAFFTYLSLDEAFRHDRLIKQGREDEILDEMYK